MYSDLIKPLITDSCSHVSILLVKSEIKDSVDRSLSYKTKTLAFGNGAFGNVFVFGASVLKNEQKQIYVNKTSIYSKMIVTL